MIFLNKCSKRLNYCLIFLLFVVFLLNHLKSNDENIILINGLNAKSPFKYIDFSKNISENKKFDSFECIELKKIFVSPVLCIHDPKRDYTSNIIKRTGIKEESIIQFFMNFLKENPESLFIDIGSHVGLYSVYAGKFGHKVIAVEAFIENIYRFHKAVKINNLTNNIILLNNAISDKKGLNVEIKSHKNFGEQSILGQEQLDSSLNPKSIKTIVFDDLLEILPKKSNGIEFKSVVLKIDIEGFEPYAFKSAQAIFKALDFKLIIMEWHQIKKNSKIYLNDILNMISFLERNGLSPYANGSLLDTKKWLNWPFDVYWIKQ